MTTPRRRSSAIPPQSEVINPQSETYNPGEDDEDEPAEDAFGDLAFLENAETDITWGVDRYKTADEVRENPRGKGRVFVTTIDGPINLAAFVREHGGGVFRFYGRRGTVMIGSKKIELAGPRLDYNITPAPPAPAATARANGHAPESDDALRMRRMMRRMMRELQELKTRAAQPANAIQAPASPPLGIDQIFTIADKIANKQQPPESPIESLIAVFEKGLNIGTAREPVAAAEGTDWMSIVKEFAPVIRDGVAMMAEAARARAQAGGAPRPAARGPAPQAPLKPSGTFDNVPEAQVVETVPTQPAAPQPPAESHRWLTAIESMAQSIADGEDPREFAFTLSRILNTQELALLRFASPEQVMDRMAPYATDLPVLGTDESRAFITAVLAELRNPTEDGTEAGQ